MKALLFIVLASTFCNTIAQLPYYDALELKKLSPNGRQLTDEKIPKAYIVFARYVTKSNPTDLEILAELSGNPFLKGLFPSGGGQGEETFGSAKVTAPLTSGLNMANFADGLAKFLVERTKEELSITFFSQFSKDLKKYPDLRLLFPATFSWLSAIDTEIYNYSSYLTMLREAFIKDLQVIIPNLKKVVQDPRHNGYFNARPPLKDIFLLALSITEGLQHTEHPGDILHDLAEQFRNEPSAYVDLGTREPNLKPSVRLLDVLVRSLKSKSSTSYLVPFDSIKTQLLADEVTFRIYLGLVYSQSKDLQFVTAAGPVTISSLVGPTVQTITSLQLSVEKSIREISYRGHQLHESLVKIKEQNRSPETKATYNEYYAHYDATLNLLEYIGDIPKAFNIPITWASNKDLYFFTARKLGEIYLDANQKKYASVILNAAIVYDSVLGKKVSPEVSPDVRILMQALADEKLKERLESIITKGQIDAVLITQLKAIVADEESKMKKELQKLIEETSESMKSHFSESQSSSRLILKYGNFAAQIAEAENSEEVKKAIEAIALPPGSSAMKTASHFSITLNGYLGVGHGWEINGKSTFFGVSAPVGVAFNFGTGGKGVGAISFFGSVIDVGAFATYRFNSPNEDLNALPEATFQNIWAPGAHLVIGRIANTPIALMTGVQYGPAISKVASTGASVEDPLWRFSVSLAVDIPIVNFYVKPRD